MTLYEALEELGIGHDASAAEARRAYLRLLKQRRPEADPTGFMRLREAYDTAKPHLESRDAFLQVLQPPRAEVPVPPEVAEAETDAPRGSDPQVAPAPDPDPSGKDEREPEPYAFRGGDPQVAPTPDPNASSEDAHATRGGDLPVAPKPDVSSEDDGASGEDEPEPPDEATVALLIAAGAHVAAAEELDRLIAASAQQLHGAAPPVATAIRLILTLHAENALDAAASLHASLSKWLRASGQEARFIRGDVAVRWSLVRELASLPRGFPAAMRGPIARAILAGDLGRSKGELDAFRLRKAAVARAGASALRTSAPILAAAVAAVLDPPIAAPSPPVPARGGGGGFKGGWAIITVLIAIVRLISYAGRSTPSPSYNTPSYDSPSRYRPPALDLPPSLLFDGGFAFPPMPGSAAVKDALLRRVESARVHAWYMQGRDGGANRIDYTRVSLDIDAMAIAVERDDCKAAGAAMKKIKARMAAGGGAATDDLGWDEVQGLETALGAFCAAQPKTSRAGSDAGSRAVLDAGRRGGTDRP